MKPEFRRRSAAADDFKPQVAHRAQIAEEQVRVFYAMRDQAQSSSPIQAVESLEYVADYYPSGTKQTSGARLDRLVEAVRVD